MSHPIALITGASSGIGHASALALQRSGFRVVATARDPRTLGDLTGAGCVPVALDVTDEGSMRAAVEAVSARHGPVTVLVNNAGYGLNGPVEELALDDIRREFETNVFGLVRMSQLVLPGMRAQGHGRILNIGSVGGSFTAPGAGAYHASKYAVEAFSDALRYEVKSFGVDVVLIKPTGVRTPFMKKINASMRDTGPDSPYRHFKANLARTVEGISAGAGGVIGPDDVARVVVQAATARTPRTRYVVGLSGHMYIGMRRLVGDRTWDWLMSSQFPMTAAAKRV